MGWDEVEVYFYVIRSFIRCCSGLFDLDILLSIHQDCFCVSFWVLEVSSVEMFVFSQI